MLVPMDLYQKLFNLARAPQIISVGELNDACGYRIVSVRRTETKFGQAVIADIEMPDGLKKGTCLPSRFNRQFTDDDLVELSNGHYYIRCTGKEGKSYNVDIYKK
ncbi:MAG: hypothetical protein E6K54_00070 [Gammaproteobacteria bacterium]|nr:MAG: hypothetical protein E6K54_00070 [Gammaproteobacteria bacterium]